MCLIGRGGKDGMWEEDERGCGGVKPTCRAGVFASEVSGRFGRGRKLY